MAETLGQAWVDVDARVDPDADKHIATGLRKELKDADKEFERAGEQIGIDLSKGMEREVAKHGKSVGKTLADSVEHAIEDEFVDFNPNWRWNRRGSNGRFISRVASDIEEDIGNAFLNAASSSGGFFNKISRGISDAIGAGFNLSGKSPLIPLLIPAVGSIVGLVLAAIQAANSLIAVLGTIPALIGAIGIQVGVLFLAFKGVGTAIQGAFAAKNAKELKEALVGLTPAAQTFVKSLLPLKKFFDTLKAQVQESFFKAFGDTIPKIAKSFSFLTDGRLASVATALGDFFEKLGLFFASPTFVTFVKELIPAIRVFLSGFGDNLVVFLKGFISFATALIPFLSSLGNILGGTLFQLGVFFDKAARDPATTKWLDDMLVTFESLIELIGGLVQFITVFLAQLNKAGGQSVLDEIITDIELLTFFLASPVGQKALEGLIHSVIIALQITTGLIIVFLTFFAAIEAFFEWLTNTAIPAIGDFFDMVGGAVLGFTDMAGAAISDFFDMVGGAVIDGFNAVVNFFVWLWTAFTNGKGRLLLLVAQLPTQIKEALGNLAGLLLNAGQSLVQGLINGIKSMFSALKRVGGDLIHQVTQFFPGSPAEEGPLSGRGYSLYRGQRLVQDFAKGMQMEIPTLQSTSNEAVSNITFGANSIRVGFEGAVPTQAQAAGTGAAVANGISSGLAARNVRLAVRTI